MPLITVNMATPIYNRESQIYFLPDSNSFSGTTVGVVQNSNKKYKYLKVFELIFSLVVIITFMLGAKATESTVQDMLVCVCFGSVIVYPVLYFITPLSIERNAITLITCNCISGFTFVILGTAIVCSWWSIQIALDETKARASNVYVEAQYFATMKLISSLGSYITSLIYIPETLLMALEYKGYI